jgi:hypothetical protein
MSGLKKGIKTSVVLLLFLLIMVNGCETPPYRPLTRFMVDEVSNSQFGSYDNVNRIQCYLSTDIFLQKTEQYRDSVVFGYIHSVHNRSNKIIKIPKGTKGKVFSWYDRNIKGIKSIILSVGFDGYDSASMEFVCPLENGTNYFGKNYFFLSSVYNEPSKRMLYNDAEYEVTYNEAPILLVDYKSFSDTNTELKILSGREFYEK